MIFYKSLFLAHLLVYICQEHIFTKNTAMKTLLKTLAIALLLAGVSPLAAQNWPEEYLGLPGDNLNLYAVMNLFQDSETLEGFERSLNDPESVINNLDLNGDGYVDYIMVFDYVEGNIHNIVLRVALNQKEHQDVAVFVVERIHDSKVQVQLIGDVALYGPNYIVEPVYAETPNPGYMGGNNPPKVAAQNNVTVVSTTYYEVSNWPVIMYIYRPTYSVWRSAWYWGYYPPYWTPWEAHYWHFYYGYHYNYYGHYYTYYRPWRHHRCGRYHTVYYTSIRNHSPTVVVNINNGRYRDTYSKPERKRDGEALYAHRQTRLGLDRTERSRVDRQPRPQDNTNVNRPSTVTRQREEQVGTGSRLDPRQTKELNRDRQPATSNTRVRREAEAEPTRPSRETAVKPKRPSSQPSGSRESSSHSRERQSTPPRNVDRSSSERETPARTTPSETRKERPSSTTTASPKPQRQEKRSESSSKSSDQQRSRTEETKSNRSSRK